MDVTLRESAALKLAVVSLRGAVDRANREGLTVVDRRDLIIVTEALGAVYEVGGA